MPATSIMPHEVLEAFTRQNIAMHGSESLIEFAWHGGEPLLAGLDFFHEAVKLQHKYGSGRKILNTLQTNSTLLNDDFCKFFRENNFLLGVSIDGPEEVHNTYRENSFAQVIRGIDLLKKYEIPFSKKHVQLIDSAIENLHCVQCSLCVHNPLCGHSESVEANGDVYSCDRYAFPAYYLGNIRDNNLETLMALNKEFGFHKTYGLSNECLCCKYVKLCFGGCPKDRQDGRNYLCDGYKIFFANILTVKNRGC